MKVSDLKWEHDTRRCAKYSQRVRDPLGASYVVIRRDMHQGKRTRAVHLVRSDAVLDTESTIELACWLADKEPADE